VSAYIGLEGEANPIGLARTFAREGCEICYPRVHQKAQPLWFHVPVPGEHFVRSPFGVLEPRPDWPVATPDVLLVPLLAFDAEGYRLGYGGGFYDRTLAHLRTSHRVAAIGVAFAGQEVPSVPHDASDEKLDMLVTERGVRRFGFE
jgi:5-formyltetrahydrofolate cyclo-ligase